MKFLKLICLSIITLFASHSLATGFNQVLLECKKPKAKKMSLTTCRHSSAPPGGPAIEWYTLHVGSNEIARSDSEILPNLEIYDCKEPAFVTSCN